MIELNLLPEEYRKKKKKKLELPEIPIIPTAIILVAGLAALQLLLGGLTLLCKSRLSSLDKSWQALEPEKAELDSIKLEIKTTAKKINTIEELIERRLSWTNLLNELSASLTANVWLTEVLYEKKARALKISGSSSARGEEATRDIARFIKALKANMGFFKYFDDIELVSIKESKLAGQDVMNFTLSCRAKPEKTGA